jgi:hypothetical protein
MEKVKLSSFVSEKLKELSKTLYDNEYFGFLEDSEMYVEYLKEFIYSIPTLKRKRTANPKNGVFYCKYKHNHKTTWYASFDIQNDFYLVKNITNNHSTDYSDFIANL